MERLMKTELESSGLIHSCHLLAVYVNLGNLSFWTSGNLSVGWSNKKVLAFTKGWQVEAEW